MRGCAKPRTRWAGSRSRASVAVGIAAVAALTVLPAQPSLAAMTSAIPAAPASVALEARTSDVAATLRADVAAVLQDYISGYGDRFTQAERKQLLTYKADADRQLLAVVIATRRLEQATASGASLALRRARGVAAQAAWRRAKARADSSFASARQILEPKLSLMERLSAARDYSTLMGRFDDLGAQIDAEAARASRSRWHIETH